MKRSIDQAALIVRLAWAVAVPLVAGLSDDLSGVLAVTIGLWVVLTVASEWRAPQLTSLLDLGFVLAAVMLTGLATSPLWWGVLVGTFLTSYRWSMLPGMGFASAALVISMGAGALGESLQDTDLGALGRAMLAILMLAPLVSWMGIWLQRRAAAIGGGAGGDRGDNSIAASMLGLSAELNANLALERIPELVARLASQALGDADDRLSSVLLVRQENGFSPLPSNDVSIGADQGLLGEAIVAGGPRKSNHAVDDPVIRSLGLGEQARAAVCVPLTINGEASGALLLTHPQRDYFDGERIHLLNSVGLQASAAIHNALMFRGLELERDRIAETEEEARKKLARVLHDGPTQTIAAIAMRLDYARRLIDRDQAAARQEIQTLEDIARQTTREIRHMLFTLRPLVLESKGLVAALHQLSSKMHETHGQNVVVEAQPAVAEGLSTPKQAVIFFIAEEAINNAHKHAEAGNVHVRLHRADPDRIVLEVRDDGVGFNVGAVDAHYEQRGSLGMVNMRERAELVDGVLRIESSEGKGTYITLEVPLAGESTD